MNHCTIAAAHATDPSWQPEHLLACEARHLLALPLHQRRAELAAPMRAQRQAALQEEMNRQFAANRSAA